MSLFSKVGSFAAATTTGGHAVTGVGFQPKLLFLWGNGRTSDGSNAYSTAGVPNTDQPWSFGICAATGASSDQACVSSEEDFVLGGPLYSGDGYHVKSKSTTHGIRFDGTPGTGISLDSDGFTPNYLDALNASVINYMAVGGTDLQTSIIGAFDITAFSTGNHAFTGMGFKPDAVILWGGTVNSSGIGFVSSLTDRFAMSNGFLTNAAEYFRNDKAFVCMYQQTKDYEADIVSFDSDGCTINFSTINGAASGNTMNFVLLGLKGVSFKAGTFTEPGSTGNSAVSGVGFQPSAVLLNSLMYPASTTPQTQTAITGGGASWMVGGTDGSNRGAIAYRSWTDGCTYLNRTKVYASLNDTGTVQSQADIASLDANGFTLNFSSVSGRSDVIGYFAVGPLPAAATGYLPTRIANRRVGPRALRYRFRKPQVFSPGSAGPQTIPVLLTATTATTATQGLQVGKNFNVTTATSASMTKQIAKTFTVTIATTATLQALKVILKTLSATVATTASMTKQVGKPLTVTVATSSSLIKQVGKVFSVTVATTATLTTIKVKTVAMNATVTTTATMTRMVGKPLSVTVSTSASLVKQVGKMFTQTVATTATLTTLRVKTVLMNATVATTATMSRQTQKAMNVTVATTATLSKRISKTLSSTVSTTASLVAQFVGVAIGPFAAAVVVQDVINTMATVVDSTATSATVQDASDATVTIIDKAP